MLWKEINLKCCSVEAFHPKKNPSTLISRLVGTT